MENPAIILWIPIILLSVASIIKMLNKDGPNGKSWIRIEKVEENDITDIVQFPKLFH